MGSSQSIEQNVAMSIFTENLIEIMQKVTNKSNTTCSIEQDIEFVNKGEINCPIDISQKARMVCNLDATFNSKNGSDLQSLVSTALDQTLSSSNTTLQDFLSTSYSNADLSQSVEDHIRQVVSTRVNEETLNTCISQASVKQGTKIVNEGKMICPYDLPLKIGQDAQVEVLANCVASAVQDAITKDILATSSTVKQEGSNYTKQTGLGEVLNNAIEAVRNVVSNVIDKLGNIGLAWVIGIVLIILVLLGGVTYILTTEGGQKFLEDSGDALKDASKGAKYIK